MSINLSLLLCFLLPLSLLFGCSDNQVQAPRRIGIINPNPNLQSVVTGFKQGLESLGYFEGPDVVYFDNGPLADMATIDQAYSAMEKNGVELFLVCTQMAASRMKILTAQSRIPVVAAPFLYPVQTRLVTSIQQPGGNITGVQVGGGISRVLGLLKTIKPDTDRLYVPIAFEEPANALAMEELKTYGQSLAIEVEAAPVANELELNKAMERIPPEADAVWLFNSPFLVSRIDAIVQGASRSRIPVVSTTAQYEKGVLLSYSQDSLRTGEQASRMANKILKGISPASLPVETAELFLGLNLKIADKIGLFIPDSILRQADFIVR